MIFTFYNRVSTAAATAIQTVRDIDVQRVTDSTKQFFQNTMQGCLQLYGQQGPVGEEDPPAAADDTGKASPDEQVGETWEEVPESIFPQDPLAAAIPAPQQTPVVVLAHQDDLLGPRTRDIDLSTVDLEQLAKSSADIRARHAALKAAGQ